MKSKQKVQQLVEKVFTRGSCSGIRVRGEGTNKKPGHALNTYPAVIKKRKSGITFWR